MIIPIWKKIGESSHLLAQKVGILIFQKTKNENDLKSTHTGTLDPMAQGIVVVLTGDDRFKKATFSSWKKKYEFEVLFGVNTDSYDLLGITNDIKIPELERITSALEKLIPKFIGPQKQTQPKFSSQRIDGKSGFDLAKNNISFEQKINEIEIFSLLLKKIEMLPIKKVEEIINKNISKIEGDFRQNEISNNWKNIFIELKKLGIKNLPIAKLEALVSKRTYIRSLTNDISKELNIPATTFTITRTENGNFQKKDCLNFL